MMRKLLLLTFWFPISCGLIALNLALLNSNVLKTHTPTETAVLSPLGDITPYQIAAANTSMVLGTQVVAGDARGLLLSQFLTQYDSPLAPYADLIVDEADKNGIDFRLVVAIAMCESNLGKHIPSHDSHNAWGIQVYTGQQFGAVFPDWPTAIHWVSKYLREKYIDQGFHTLKEIGAIYAPPSVLTGNSWSKCVESFQTSIF